MYAYCDYVHKPDRPPGDTHKPCLPEAAISSMNILQLFIASFFINYKAANQYSQQLAEYVASPGQN